MGSKPTMDNNVKETDLPLGSPPPYSATEGGPTLGSSSSSSTGPRVNVPPTTSSTSFSPAPGIFISSNTVSFTVAQTEGGATVFTSTSQSQPGQQTNYYPTTVQPTPTPTLQPIPVSAFREQVVAAPIPSDELAVTETRLELHTSPSCEETVLMLPFPFLCLGCCMSNTADVVFDDSSKTATISGYPGYCFPMKSTTTVLYNDIANVALVKTNITKNKMRTYRLSLLLRDGKMLEMSGPCYSDELEGKAKTVHRFLFGRGNPGYRPPNVWEMML